MKSQTNHAELADLDEWEIAHTSKSKEEFRNYGDGVANRVRSFYEANHRNQTLDFVRAKKADFLALNRRKMGIWEAMEFLNTLVDESDPDTELSQIQHLMQTAEAIRADGHPSWFILTGLVHDLGKILCLWNEPQWAVVGDTFPVGCAFSDKIVFSEFFDQNPDKNHPVYQTKLGLYHEGIGLDSVEISWGHDEYLYHVLKEYLPEEGLAMIRYHSCYPIHNAGEYAYLLNDHDRHLMSWVRTFNPYDLYSKGQAPPDVEALTPYYKDLIAEFFPPVLDW